MNDSIVFVGLDVHKKEHAAAVFADGSNCPLEMTVLNQQSDLDRWLRGLQRKFPSRPIQVAYEAGVCGFDLRRRIQREGVVCKVIAPSLMPVVPGERVRTDRRDAAGLGRNLRDGRLVEVHPPDEQEEALRDLCRSREAMVEDLRRSRQRVLKFLLRRGYSYMAGKHWTKGHLAWLETIRLDKPLAQEVFDGYVAEVAHRQQLLAELDKRVTAVAQEEPYAQKVGWIRCLQGFDTITAICLLAELFGFERFTSPRRLMKYLGMTPSESTSGPTVRRGPITKAGNKRVRRLLTEAAWHQRHRAQPSAALLARRKGQPSWAISIAQKAQARLYHRFRRLSDRGLPANKVVMAVARESVGFVWALLQGPPVAPLRGDPQPRRRQPNPPPAPVPPGAKKPARDDGLGHS